MLLETAKSMNNSKNRIPTCTLTPNALILNNESKANEINTKAYMDCLFIPAKPILTF
jgi:hypothetical protein